MEKLIIQYGVYLNGKLVCPYNTREDAEDAADFAQMETGVPHEIKEIRQASKLDY